MLSHVHRWSVERTADPSASLRDDKGYGDASICIREKFPGGIPTICAQRTAASWSTTRHWCGKILVDWGFDGLKLDGQDMNGVPACYNPAHHHAQPEDSVEALPDFFRAIYETAQAVKPGALVEFCPCGTAFSFFTMPHFNMSVASDPESSFQVRSKAKTLKALMGDDIPFFGDQSN